MGDERRQTERFAVDGRVRLVAGAKTLYGAMRNLSIGGMLVDLKPPLLRRGTEVQASFKVGDFQIETRAEVARHQGSDSIGLRFLRLDADELKAIESVSKKPG